MRSLSLRLLGLLLLGIVSVAPLSAATITVTSAADSGAGSLRDALTTANSTAGVADTIVFAAGLSGQTIHLLSDLPSLADNATTINGDTNADGKPDIALSGDQAFVYYGLKVDSYNSTIRGLCVNRCEYGLYLSSARGARVYSCYFGTNLAGTAPAPNRSNGLYAAGAANVIIGGTAASSRNLVSGNYGYGIYLHNCPSLTLRNLYCGLNAAGNARIPNGNYGIYAQYCDNLIVGDTATAVKTVISGNAGNGLYVTSSTSVAVRHTYIGTNAAGTSMIPNSSYGVYLNNCNYATVGGTGTTDGNLISGNASHGLYASNCYGGPTLQGNLMGTDLAGTAALPNTSAAVYMSFCSGAVVGGTVTAARNVISGNDDDAVSLSQCTAVNVQGNYLGVDKTGNVALRNGGDGVQVSHSATVYIGGSSTTARNVIVGDGDGVKVGGSLCYNVNVRNNYIGYGADGTTALPCGTGVTLSSGARNVSVGAVGESNQILVEGYGINCYLPGTGCTIVSNRIGAPVGSPAYGSIGIYLYQCSSAVNRNSVFQQSDSALYVSGARTTPIITNNTFRKNNRGVYIGNSAQPNLGDLANAATNDDGNNNFYGNRDFDIYNTTANDIRAEGNTFASTSSETIDGRLIYDKLDNPSCGRVDYNPLKSGPPTVLSVPTVLTMAVTPAGSGAAIVMTLSAPADLEVQLMNIAGRPIRQWASLEGRAGVNTLRWDGRSSTGTAVPSGSYLVVVTCRSEDGGQIRQTARLYLER